MANIALFINPTEIKATTYLDENTDDELIRNVIALSQDLYIHQIIGTGLFEELKTQILAATTTSLNQTLLGHIQFSLKFWVLYEGLEIFTFKFMNKSVMKKDSENSKPIDLKEMDRLKDKFRNTAEWYSQRRTKYLDQNQSSFPLWQNPGSDIDTIHPNRNNYSTGWNLNRPNKCSDINKYEYPGSCCD